MTKIDSLEGVKLKGLKKIEDVSGAVKIKFRHARKYYDVLVFKGQDINTNILKAINEQFS